MKVPYDKYSNTSVSKCTYVLCLLPSKQPIDLSLLLILIKQQQRSNRFTFSSNSTNVTAFHDLPRNQPSSYATPSTPSPITSCSNETREYDANTRDYENDCENRRVRIGRPSKNLAVTKTTTDWSATPWSAYLGHFCNPLFPPRPPAVSFQNGVGSHSFASHPALPIRIHLRSSPSRIPLSAYPLSIFLSYYFFFSFPPFPLSHALSTPSLPFCVLHSLTLLGPSTPEPPRWSSVTHVLLNFSGWLK